VALRLWTVGSAVLDGNRLAVTEGRGVSVIVSVGVREAVSVEDGRRGGSVNAMVPTKVGDTGLDVRVHANEAIMHRIEKTSFLLIVEVYVPFQDNIPE